MNKFEIKDINNRIDNYVSELLSNYNVKAFYPGTIAKKLNIPLIFVLNRMSDKLDEDILTIKYEIRCDNIHLEIVVDNYDDYLGQYVYCRHCGEEFYVSKENIYLKYYVNEEYRDYLKKKVIAI